jgi:hypothetical protein
MPFTDLKGAARLVERIDEILALVRSWPGESSVYEGIPTRRNFTADDLFKFNELDGRIGGLMRALGMAFPPSQLQESQLRFAHGYTHLWLFRRRLTADYPHEWERRLLAVKHASQEILDVSDEKKSSGKHPDTADVRDLCAMLADPANRGKPKIGIARSLTKERAGKDKKAHSLLRQARRFPHLWRQADS